MSRKEREMCIEKESGLSVRHQCVLLGLCRGTLYYTPSMESEENLRIMELLDKQYMETPFYGELRLQAWLRTQGYEVNIKRLRRLMRKVRWRTLYPTRCTTHADEKAYKYPYLLKGLTIDHPNHVWEIDISYIPMRHGFMYLLAIIDVFSRYVVGWSLSNTMDTEWCMGIVQEAFRKHGRPEIFNSDQGSQFTSANYVELLKGNHIRISMDSRGRALDDGYVTSFRECWLHLNHSSKLDGVRFAQHFIERLWRSVKQEYVYLNPCTTGDELWHGLNGYFEFYNEKRLHQSLDYRTPAEVYRKGEVTAA